MYTSMVQILRRMIGLEQFPRQKGSHWWECTVFSVHGNLKVEFSSWSEETDWEPVLAVLKVSQL